MERARLWAEENEKKKVNISRVNAETRKMATKEAKKIVRKKANDVQRAAAEAAAKIRVKTEAERAKRDR